MKQIGKKNRAGRVEEIAFIDDNGEPVVNDVYGCAKIKRTFDASNRLIEERYCGVSGEPVIHKDHGFAKITWVHCGSRTVKFYHRHLHSKRVVIDSTKLEKIIRAGRQHVMRAEKNTCSINGLKGERELNK